MSEAARTPHQQNPTKVLNRLSEHFAQLLSSFVRTNLPKTVNYSLWQILQLQFSSRLPEPVVLVIDRVSGFHEKAPKFPSMIGEFQNDVNPWARLRHEFMYEQAN